MRTTTRSWFGFQTHFPDRNSGRRIELFVFEGGYAGLGPVEGGRLNLALIASVGALKSSGGSPDRLLENRMLANPLLAGRIGGRSPSSPWKTVGPLRFGTRRPAAAGAIFLGDAAGTTDPFSGEGMSNALAAAELALPFVLAAVAAGGLAPAAARAWSRAWRAAFSRATWRARLFGRLFQHERTALWAMSWLSTRAGASLLPRLIAATRTGPL
jgi:flavin-dependent dehydrogenase